MSSGQVDVADHEFALEWMRDSEVFQRALEQVYVLSLSIVVRCPFTCTV